jgi:hypothetical protein
MWSFRLILVLSFVAVFCLIVASVAANAADNLPNCLTQHQARDKYPTQHLFWYYANRHARDGKCWSNRRGGPPRMRDPVMGHTQVGQLNAIKYYPRPFDVGATPFTPSVVIDPRDAPDDGWPPLTEFDERWGPRLLRQNEKDRPIIVLLVSASPMPTRSLIILMSAGNLTGNWYDYDRRIYGVFPTQRLGE